MPKTQQISYKMLLLTYKVLSSLLLTHLMDNFKLLFQMDVVEDAENQLDRVTNEEVLVCGNEARSILKTIWCRKHRWLRHVLRHVNLLHAGN